MTVTEAPGEVDLDVTPLSGRIGAVIRGLDLRNVTDDQVAAVRRVWLERKVVFFPRADLDPDSHLAFAARFGEPTEGHPVIPGVDGYPNIHEIDYAESAKLQAQYGNVARRQYSGLSWHTDVTFVKRPPLGSILRAVTIPPAGGDTAFSNQQAAFEALSPSLRSYLETLHAVHTGEIAFGRALEARGGEGQWEGKPYTDADLKPVVHPLVRTHPETGKKALFVNPGFTSHIVELDRRESDVLLHFLYQHSVRPEFVVRYHWTAGDVGFWDNRATQHVAVYDYGATHRRAERVTVSGPVPVGVDGRPSVALQGDASAYYAGVS